MTLKILGVENQPRTGIDTAGANGAFSLSNDPAPTRNSKGGTEMQLQWLYESVDNDLLDKFQIISSRVRWIEKNKPSILWLHDCDSDPEAQHLSNKENRKRFAKLVFVSNWQRQLFELRFGILPSENIVMQNAIHPIPAADKDDKLIRLIYHTTPHRGLNILVSAFTTLCGLHDNIVLDVYSSFEIYGWGDKDKEYKDILDVCKEHPQINYHGAVPNDEVREALQKAHIFAYPSTWPETSCISALEAMSARCLMVAPNFGALPETCANWAWMYPFMENQSAHANMFVNVLNQAILKLREPDVQNNLDFQKMYFDRFYNWELRGNQWAGFLQGLNY